MDQLSALVELRPTLLRLARLQLRNDAWAEEVVSATLLAAPEGATKLSGLLQIKTWVFGVLRHKIADQFRRVRSELCADARQEIAKVESPEKFYNDQGAKLKPPLDWGDREEGFADAEFSEIVQQCLAKLPANQARALMMREWLEYEPEQISQQFGISSDDCLEMLYRARVELRECVEKSWFESGRAR